VSRLLLFVALFDEDELEKEGDTFSQFGVLEPDLIDGLAKEGERQRPFVRPFDRPFDLEYRTSLADRAYFSSKILTKPPPGLCLTLSSDPTLDDTFHSSFLFSTLTSPPPFIGNKISQNKTIE